MEEVDCEEGVGSGAHGHAGPEDDGEEEELDGGEEVSEYSFQRIVIEGLNEVVLGTGGLAFAEPLALDYL